MSIWVDLRPRCGLEEPLFSFFLFFFRKVFGKFVGNPLKLAENSGLVPTVRHGALHLL